MTSEWPLVRIGDVCDLCLGKMLDQKKNKGKYRKYLGNSNVRWGCFDLSELSEMKFEEDEDERYGIKRGDLIICEGGEPGRCAIWDEQAPDMMIQKALHRVRPKDSSCDIRYLFYWLTMAGRLGSLDPFFTGTTIKHLTGRALADVSFPLPPVFIQREIASTLSTLDARIAVNKKINHHLVQMAQIIFKSWFVDFEPWDGEIPEGWTYTTLDALCSLIAKGITPQYDESSAEIVINQKCIRNKAIDLSLARRHRPKRINEKWLKYGDILINSTGEGTLGRVAQFFIGDCNFTVDSHITIVRPIEDELVFFLGQWCLQRESEFAAMASGSTGQTDLPRERLKAMECIFPDAHTLLRFSQVLKPLVEMQVAAQIESARLATLRDTLLPCLMSGALSVADLDDAK